MTKREKKQIKLNINNDFDLPESKPKKLLDQYLEIEAKTKGEKPAERKEKNNKKNSTTPPPAKNYIRLNSDGIVISKVGFELPEEDDKNIEVIAAKLSKKKKDLLAEIVQEWLERNRKKY